MTARAGTVEYASEKVLVCHGYQIQIEGGLRSIGWDFARYF